MSCFGIVYIPRERGIQQISDINRIKFCSRIYLTVYNSLAKMQLYRINHFYYSAILNKSASLYLAQKEFNHVYK